MSPARPKEPPSCACRHWIGTSGYNYPEWKGSFYPAKFPAAKMLPFYAARFTTVEINYTFYRLPNEKVLLSWAEATPEGFQFTLKAPRRITHDAKLEGCEDLLRYFWTVSQALGPKLGVLLFQLPPSFKKNLRVFNAFLEWLPPNARAAFEFRHDSWHDEDLFSCLRERNLALCIADSERMTTPFVPTASYGYFRLRDEGYQEADIEKWAAAIKKEEGNWSDVFIYFKHEEEGKGPEFARRLMERLGPGPPSLSE